MVMANSRDVACRDFPRKAVAMSDKPIAETMDGVSDARNLEANLVDFVRSNTGKVRTRVPRPGVLERAMRLWRVRMNRMNRAS